MLFKNLKWEYLLNEKGAFFHWNEIAEEIFGYSKLEVMRQLIPDIFAKSNKEDEELSKEIIYDHYSKKVDLFLQNFPIFFPKETLPLIFFVINI
ncbi:MAG: hypothetical protein BAJALOKI2v1_160046 [Promethearchaeota archaeon]|nr:MAG: hypothetical protein BAJALOKI2v1_160046 [Candidatus Lokiarchaeota archaeon]